MALEKFHPGPRSHRKDKKRGFSIFRVQQLISRERRIEEKK